jgi:hypothetical protein
MPAILMRILLCVAILPATMIALVAIGSIRPRKRLSSVRVLMFSSLQEATRYWAITAPQWLDSSSVTKPRYVAEIGRYFVLVEDTSSEGSGSDSTQPPKHRRKLGMNRGPRRFPGTA